MLGITLASDTMLVIIRATILVSALVIDRLLTLQITLVPVQELVTLHIVEHVRPTILETVSLLMRQTTHVTEVLRTLV